MKVYTTKIVAKWLDMTERNVRQLTQKKVLSEYKPGLYKLRETIHEYIQFLRNQNPESEDVDYNEERAKLVKVKREHEELELMLKKGEAHKTEEVEQVLTDMLIKFKTRLMAIPAKQSPILVKKTDQTEVFRILKAAIDEALEELSDYDSTFGRDTDGTEYD